MAGGVDPALADRTATHLAGIEDASLPVRSITIPGIDGSLEARILSTDQRGSSTRLVRLLPGWGPETRGAFSAEVELFVIQGSIEVGAHALGAGDYVHIPKGRTVPRLHVTAGGSALLMTSAPVGFDRSFQGPPADLVPGRAADRDWVPVPEMPGRHIKPLGRGPVGDVWLAGAREWDHRDGAWHRHPHHEECFIVGGEVVLRERHSEPDEMLTAGPGTYFFRPAGTLHCGPGSRCDDTLLAFHRAFGNTSTEWPHSPTTDTGTGEPAV